MRAAVLVKMPSGEGYLCFPMVLDQGVPFVNVIQNAVIIGRFDLLDKIEPIFNIELPMAVAELEGGSNGETP